MKHFQPLLVWVILLSLLTGCGQKCEDFNNDIVNWMPYKASEKIPVYNGYTHDTLTVLYSEIHYTRRLGYGVKCTCENSYYLKLTSDSLELEIDFNESRDITRSEIYVNGEGLFYAKQLDKMEIMGNQYNDLIEFAKSSQNDRGTFDSIIVAKSVGIILIKGPGIEWSTIDNAKKIINVSDLKFISKNCG